MAKEGFEAFMKSGADPHDFSSALERAIAAEVTRGPERPAGCPDFDTYGISPLGFVVSEELARVISISQEEFSFCPPAANPLVPGWVKFGNQVLKGATGSSWERVYKKAEEESRPTTGLDEDAIEIAISCVHNGATAVKDANLIARSIVSLTEPHPGIEIGTILRNSTVLITRMAMMNDTGSTSEKGTGTFRREAGVEDSNKDTITPGLLHLDPEKSMVDLSPEGIALQRECSIPGEGCPALRIPVEFRGASMPMILAFWQGGVDVIETRIPR